jgi:hypothetical protein
MSVALQRLKTLPIFIFIFFYLKLPPESSPDVWQTGCEIPSIIFLLVIWNIKLHHMLRSLPTRLLLQNRSRIIYIYEAIGPSNNYP